MCTHQSLNKQKASASVCVCSLLFPILLYQRFFKFKFATMHHGIFNSTTASFLLIRICCIVHQDIFYHFSQTWGPTVWTWFRRCKIRCHSVIVVLSTNPSLVTYICFIWVAIFCIDPPCIHDILEGSLPATSVTPMVPLWSRAVD